MVVVTGVDGSRDSNLLFVRSRFGSSNRTWKLQQVPQQCLQVRVVITHHPIFLSPAVRDCNVALIQGRTNHLSC